MLRLKAEKTFYPHETIQIRVAETLTPQPSQGLTFQLYKRVFGRVTGAPPHTPGTVYLVSALVKQALPLRSDFWSPGELVRDDKGVITGCKGFII